MDGDLPLKHFIFFKKNVSSLFEYSNILGKGEQPLIYETISDTTNGYIETRLHKTKVH